jgi:hypothetical protein
VRERAQRPEERSGAGAGESSAGVLGDGWACLAIAQYCLAPGPEHHSTVWYDTTSHQGCAMPRMYHGHSTFDATHTRDGQWPATVNPARPKHPSNTRLVRSRPNRRLPLIAPRFPGSIGGFLSSRPPAHSPRRAFVFPAHVNNNCNQPGPFAKRLSRAGPCCMQAHLLVPVCPSPVPRATASLETPASPGPSSPWHRNAMGRLHPCARQLIQPASNIQSGSLMNTPAPRPGCPGRLTMGTLQALPSKSRLCHQLISAHLASGRPQQQRLRRCRS